MRRTGPYNAIEYWKRAGSSYRTWFYEQPQAMYDTQMQELRAFLATLPGVGSVLDLGCGFGRATAVARSVFPNAEIDGVDVSAHQLRYAREAVPSATFHEWSIQSFPSQGRWDLVMAVEVLMHVPPSEIATVLAKVRGLSLKHIIHIDRIPSPDYAEHDQRNARELFLHDYIQLHRDMGRLGGRLFNLPGQPFALFHLELPAQP